LGFLIDTMWLGAYGDAPTAAPPLHWFISGQESARAIKEYIGTIDHTVAYEGQASGLLKSTADTAQSGTLMQTAAARPYLGKSIKMKAFLRSNDVAQRAGLWIRADDIDGSTVAFRNCFSRQAPRSFVKGSSAWEQVETTIAIPDSAVVLSYGVQLIGTGAVWIDDVSFDVIGQYPTGEAEHVVPTAHLRPDPQKMPPTPQNLDFEQ